MTCTCGEAWSGHPNSHALTCAMHEQAGLTLDEADCACGDTFNPKCPEHGGNEHRP